MPIGRLVPWASWDEWFRVKDGIFSTDATECKAALDQVAAWEARGKLPLGADMTAAIQRMHLRDPASASSSTPGKGGSAQVSEEQESMLRMQYAMAIIRLVNGISDSAQKGNVAKSVAHLAESAGLPRILVDVRHEASHNELPSLALLRMAAASALTWLKESYWKQQSEHVDLRLTQILQLLKAYVKSHERLEQLKAPGCSPSSDGEEPCMDTLELPEQLQGDMVDVEKLRREILSQLLSKVQSRTASLVEQLLDCGILPVQTAVSEEGTEWSKTASALWLATMRDLSALWPSLCHLLLAGAVERVSNSTWESCHAGAREEESLAWIQLLLEGPPGKVPNKAGKPSHKSKKQRKAAAEPDQEPAPSALWVPSPQLLRWCLSVCMHSSAAAPRKVVEKTITRNDAGTSVEELQSNGTPSRCLQKAIQMILRKLRISELHPPAADLHAAQLAPKHLLALSELTRLAHPGAKSCSLMADRQRLAGADPGNGLGEGRTKISAGLREAAAEQHALLHGVGQPQQPSRTSEWQAAEGWAPCAIGMLPSAQTPIGKQPSLVIQRPAQQAPQHQEQPSAGQQAQGPLGTGNKMVKAGAAEDDAHKQGRYEHSKQLKMADIEAGEQEELYFSRFDRGNAAHDTHEGQVNGTGGLQEDLQDQQEMSLQHVALAKPVRIL